MTALTWEEAWEPLKAGLQAAVEDWEFTPAAHHDAGRVLPDEKNAGNTWACSCGRLFVTQKARSNHFSVANR